MGWHTDPEGFQRCYFRRVIDNRYNVYLYFFGIIMPILLIITEFNIRIYMKYRSLNERRMTMFATQSTTLVSRRYASQKLLLQNIAIISIVFAVCWVPLYVLLAINLWSPSTRIHIDVFTSALLLTNVHSAIVPVLYARGQNAFGPAILRKVCLCKTERVGTDSAPRVICVAQTPGKHCDGVSMDEVQNEQGDHPRAEPVCTKTITTSP